MAKRYDNSFDAEGFVENFRAQDDAPAPSKLAESPKVEAGKKKIPERSVSPDAVDDYQARFIDDLKYRYPPNRWPPVMISPEFASNINRLELLCGNRRANLSTYINNVLEQHFRDCEAQIKEFKKKYNDNE